MSPVTRLAPLALLALLVLAPMPGGADEGGRPSDAEIGPEQVYLTPDEAIREIYGEVTRVDTVAATLEDGEREALARRLGAAVPPGPTTVFEPRDAAGARLGYAVIGEEVGKYRPITFLVAVDPRLQVKGVEVLVYRESRGGEIRRERFLRQYRGKTADDPIRTHRDIINVAGATLSVNALNLGVKRALAMLTALAARGAL
jgi:H+/Na+-translocating ferredoxin:NAD+ oxidoreductase subunit G